MRGVCCVCGCTEEMPCMDLSTGETCYWADESETICSACAALADEEPLVQPATEYECDRLIRAMRAGGGR